MLNRAPYNTEVPQFLPSREAPINSYITRKYPCQEHLAGKTNEFGSLTWKIQQPDPNMVWQSVKIVLPMEIQAVHKNAAMYPIVSDMNVVTSNPACNIALSQSPMNAFRQSSLSINGRIFSEDNYYRDILDTCYRGIGTQAYGDNHSLKPIVNRGIHGPEEEKSRVMSYDDATDTWVGINSTVGGHPIYARTANVAHRTVPTENSLLEHNGPFIERARIFQDNLSFDGKTWKGDVSHLLELGPFQARARKGNTAVPYIQDFHLRVNFANVPNKFDVKNPALRSQSELMLSAIAGRVMATKLLEFATPANFLHKNEVIRNYLGWPTGFTFKYTAQPYLEIVYTKHESGMRDSYNLRCFEHLYEKSNRFQLQAPPDSLVSPRVLSRVTSRLLSCPTKVYVWGEVADEYKYIYGMGGVRRSCRLENLHLRVNQRPDVMFNPSQEECYEMFRRHTNSSLEYGSWRKSPIYVFDMVDVGQPDMYSNDARITWFEWDAEVQLTELQMTEQRNLVHTDNMEMLGYSAEGVESGEFQYIEGATANSKIYALLDWKKRQQISDTDTDIHLSLVYPRNGGSDIHLHKKDGKLPSAQRLRCEEQFTATVTGADFLCGNPTTVSQSLIGCIWAKVYIKVDGNHAIGDIDANTFYYIPESFRWTYDDDKQKVLNKFSNLTFGPKIVFDDKDPDHYHFMTGKIADSYNVPDLVGKQTGTNEDGNASWAPGPFGYAITNVHTKNDSVMNFTQLTPIQEGPDNKLMWVAFAPESSMPAGNNSAVTTWLTWEVSKTRDEMNDMGLPANWKAQVAGESVDWGLGYEAVHGKYDGVWGVRNKEAFARKNVLNPNNNSIGAQMVYILPELADARVEDYQMKVLYEYGNCQYNFSRSAAPTRILPNVVPVGPSPGIPAPL